MSQHLDGCRVSSRSSSTATVAFRVCTISAWIGATWFPSTSAIRFEVFFWFSFLLSFPLPFFFLLYLFFCLCSLSFFSFVISPFYLFFSLFPFPFSFLSPCHLTGSYLLVWFYEGKRDEGCFLRVFLIHWACYS